MLFDSRLLHSNQYDKRPKSINFWIHIVHIGRVKRKSVTLSDLEACLILSNKTIENSIPPETTISFVQYSLDTNDISENIHSSRYLSARVIIIGAKNIRWYELTGWHY